MVEIEQVDNKIIEMLVNGNQVMEIASNLKRSKRYVLYRLSDLKTSFNCKTTAQLIYTLITSGKFK